MNHGNENIWFHPDTDTKEVKPYKEMMGNKFERHNIDLANQKMASGQCLAI